MEENIYFWMRKEITGHKFQNADNCYKHHIIQKTKIIFINELSHTPP